MRIVALLAPFLALSACAPDPFAVDKLTKDAASDIRGFLAANEGKTFCTNYQVSTNSCASLLRFGKNGDTVISQETGAVKVAGKVEPVTIRAKSWIEGNAVCTNAENLHLAGKPTEIGEALLQDMRDLSTQFDGMCMQVFGTSKGYISRVAGHNGKPIPPGDVTLTIAPADPKLRAR